MASETFLAGFFNALSSLKIGGELMKSVVMIAAFCAECWPRAVQRGG